MSDDAKPISWDKLSPMCQECLSKYRKKYPYRFHKGKFEKPFGIKCSPVLAKDYIWDPTKYKNWDDPGYMLNPILWAYQTIEMPYVVDDVRTVGWRPRGEYQARALLCTAQRKVDRLSRRLGKTVQLAIEALHTTFSHHRYQVLYLTPHVSQLQRFFNYINDCVSCSDVLRASISKHRMSPPFLVEFNNHSRILGLTVGGERGKATGVRGEGADLMVLDEEDYMSDTAMNAVLAILLDQPHTRFIASSTPSGRRSFFFNQCLRDHTFSEFHYDMTYLPHYNLEMREEMARQYGGEDTAAFIHELLAKFGEEEIGVYPSADLDLCCRQYNPGIVTVDTIDPRPPVIIGVDFNERYGTHMVVLTVLSSRVFAQEEETLRRNVGPEVVCPVDVRIAVVEKKVVIGGRMTQLAGIEAVQEMNFKWNPDYIYVDKGYGDFQVETLHKIGLENPLTGLANKVKRLDFGGRMKIRAPDGTMQDKRIKPFIVELSAERVKQHMCVFPFAEDCEHGIVDNLRNYRQLRKTASGQPVYTNTNDHDVSAWLAAFYGLIMNFSDIAPAVGVEKEVAYRPLDHKSEDQETVFPRRVGVGGVVNIRRPRNIPRRTWKVRRYVGRKPLV